MDDDRRREEDRRRGGGEKDDDESDDRRIERDTRPHRGEGEGDDDESDDRRIEREIRSRRRFSLAEAVGREGAFFLKGESPVGAAQRLALAMEHLIEARLRDSQEALRIALEQRARALAPSLVSRVDSAEQALDRVLDSILRNDATLRAFVSEVDALWGRLYQERPRFDRPDRPPEDDDPYTVDAVRRALERLRDAIR